MSIANILIDNGADVNNKNLFGRTPLHEVCANKNPVELTKLLLSKNSDPNAVDEFGMSPLHLAAGYSSVATISALIKAGSNINSMNVQGLTPLDIAIVSGQDSIASALLENGGKASKYNSKPTLGFQLSVGKYQGHRSGDIVRHGPVMYESSGFDGYRALVNWVAVDAGTFRKKTLIMLTGRWFGEPGHKYVYHVDGNCNDWRKVGGVIIDEETSAIVGYMHYLN